MYVISGATGNTGKIVANYLLDNGKKVRVLGRSADKLKEFTAKGAEAAVGDVSDAEFVKKAFEGATAVYCVLTPNMHSDNVRAEQQAIAKNFYEAVKANNVKNVLLLSSVGAHLRKGAGIVDGLGVAEDYFLELKDVNVLNLRPTYFMENTFGQLGVIKHMGIMGGPNQGDLKFPIVATKDIGAVAAKRLADLSFKGNTVEYVLGQRDVSYNEIAQIFGAAIGKPDLKYVQFPYPDAAGGMVGAGFCSANVAEQMIDLAKAMNDGTMLNAHVRTPENTTPTSIEEFAHTFAYVYNM